MTRERREGAVFSPADFRTYLAGRLGRPEAELRVPADVIFTYDARLFRSAIAETRATPANWYIYSDRLYLGKVGDKQVGIVHAFVGASAASMNLEELVAYGAKRIYELGVSGAIDEALAPGDVVLLSGAFSDEGTSRHYSGGKKFNPSRALSRLLDASLSEGNVGHFQGFAWTTDAPYRETRGQVRHYRRLGARVVNMESSAIFAVAAYREVEAASVQIVSDVVSEEGWKPAFHHDILDRRRGEILTAALRAIKRMQPGRTP